MREIIWKILLGLQFVTAQVPEKFQPDSLLPGTSRIYKVTFETGLVPGQSIGLPGETDLSWDYFITAQQQVNDNDIWGYAQADGRDYATLLQPQSNDVDGFLRISFNVKFLNADAFMNDANAANKMRTALSAENLNQGLNMGFTDAYMETAKVIFTVSDNCEFRGTGGLAICETRNMQCLEITDNGKVECLSVCDPELISETCGDHGTCSQIKSADFETSSRYEDHTCSCENNEWWTTGGDFGNGNDPCAPVLKNWLIIVIAVIAFLLLILLIIGIVYCCINGCRCPCENACTCCQEDEEMKYQVKGNTNPSFLGDTASSKAPLYNQYPLPETKTIENPAIWNDIHIQSYPESLQNGTLRTHADAFDDHTVPRINHKKELVYTSHDPRKHRSNRHDSGSTARSKRHHRRSGESERPTKKQMNTLEAEIKKLETDIENMKQDMNTSGNQPESLAAPDLSIQAPLPPANTAIDALELSDEEVDQPLKKYDSRAVLVETPVQKTGPGTLTGTLQDRWRVPPLTVLPVDDNPIRQVDSTVI